ncbi:v-SNARE [Candida orthopsilosis Co 90-125]|uniref:Protein transport protein BOS1 n=1 Tax=Candida orthopsilosis (strain 90-125) TaxID=1136231 RepID=H8X1S4_CANO9|nr:v-SNARE [Candida orthopsilosis Co 90-125]CCG22479.1 v-SNARE [Candida orthopsilosis Co 90-125]
MNSLYNHGLKQTQTITKDLAQFEKNLSTSPLSLQGAITTSITAFKKTIKEYTDLLDKNPTDSSFSKHEGRINKFNQELESFTSKFDALKKQREISVQEADRQELLGRRHINSAVSQPSDNPYDPNQQQQQQQQTISQREGLYNENQTLARGTEQLDRILEMGQQAFEDIVEQNETLRKVQAKFEEGLIALGVSQGTIRSVERRAKQDKLLFWFCVVMMLVVFYYILKFFR